MKSPITAVLIAILPFMLSAVMITVNQDGSADFTVVQEAIQSAADGDTVLVYPGTYYENIDFLEKSISLMSLAIITGDEQYIEQTVLDGNQAGSVIFIFFSDTAYIGGFTITGGIGQQYPPGVGSDVLCGGGIFTMYTELTVENCIIRDNRAEVGGGISFSAFTSITLKGNTITRNSADRGGGLNFGSLDPSNISLVFDSENKNSIYGNTSVIGTDITGLSNIPFELDIILDIATVDELDPYYFCFHETDGIGDYSNITLSVEETAIDRVEADLYVATWGSDSNSGLTPDYPLQRIASALLKVKADNLNPRTIHIEEGVYSPSGTGEMLPLPLKSYVTLTSDTNWTLDAEFKSNFAASLLEYGDITVRNAILHNAMSGRNEPFGVANSRMITLENIEIHEVFGRLWPGNVFYVLPTHNLYSISEPEMIISNIRINENIHGGGLAIAPIGKADIDRIMINNTRFIGFLHTHWFALTPFSMTTISNSIITGNINTQPWFGANVVSGFSHSGPGAPHNVPPVVVPVRMVNCTIAGNASLSGVVNIEGNTSFEMYNTIITGNSPNRVFLDGRYGDGNVMFSHVMLDEGLDDIQQLGNDYQFTYDNIMSGDPLFLGEGDHPYQLTAGSPAINAGTLDIPGYTFGEYDLAGNPRIYGDSIDLGAYEYQYSSVADEFQDEKMNVTVYPNPVNLDKRGSEFYCTISFNLPEQGKLVVEIYNIKGQMVRRLLDVDTPSGEYNIRWNGLNEMGRRVGTGMYFVRIAAAGRETAERVMMIK
jgi:hypothetical protein